VAKFQSEKTSIPIESLSFSSFFLFLSECLNIVKLI